jgi:hypothetical protein
VCSLLLQYRRNQRPRNSSIVNENYKELNGISAKGYLEKARELFQKMDLQWDLDELDKIAADV